jgi:hypothetical protein
MRNWLLLLTFTLCASAVHAQPQVHVEAEAVSALVQKVLLTPRANAEAQRSKFSRSRPVPRERRVRVLSERTEQDMLGLPFVRFAIDEHSPLYEGDAWHESNVGCVYPESGKVYVRQGDDYFPASSLLGAHVKPRPGACRNVPTPST